MGIGYVGDGILCGAAVQKLHIVGQTFPTLVIALLQPVERAHIVDPMRVGVGVNRRVGDAVGHNDFAGETLHGFGQEVRCFQQPAVRVVVHIDKAGGDNLALGVDALGGLSGGEIANGGNAVATDADIPLVAGGAGPIDDGAVTDGQIVQDKLLLELFDFEVVEEGSATAVLTQDDADRAGVGRRRSGYFDLDTSPIVGTDKFLRSDIGVAFGLVVDDPAHSTASVFI